MWLHEIINFISLCLETQTANVAASFAGRIGRDFRRRETDFTIYCNPVIFHIYRGMSSPSFLFIGKSLRDL
jgi:hypothetical protein